MKIKKAISLILAVLLAFCSLSAGLIAFAAVDNPRYFQRGVLTDGTNTAYWIIDKDVKVLYLSGDGVTNARTPDYPNAESAPFNGRTDVTRIVIEEDVEYVGDYVFANMKSVDTIEIQSNLLSSENSISTKAFSGDTSIRNIQSDSEAISTNTLVNAVKAGVGIFTGNWLSVVTNVISAGSDIMSDDGTLGDTAVDAMVNDYITNGETVFLGDLEEVVEEYEYRIECPCYTNNAYHHNFTTEVVTAPDCTHEGLLSKYCTVCERTETEAIPATGHNYVEEVYLEPTCTKRGVMDCHCTVCGESTFSVIPALGHNAISIPRIRPSCTSTGLTEGSYCSRCGVTLVEQETVPMTPHYFYYTYEAAKDSYSAECIYCENIFTEFDNDTSALIEAEKWFNALDSGDYTPSSYNALNSVAAKHKTLKAEDELAYPQYAIDEEITSILTKISELEPYLNIELSGENAALTCAYGEETYLAGTQSVVFGTDVTFTAVPENGYKFIAWYDVNTRRYLSTETEFTYKITSNLNLQAITAPSSYSTLTFRGEGGQVISSVSLSLEDWSELDDIDEFLPHVPVKYGYTNGRWVYNPRTVIELSLGNNQDIYAEYDEIEVDVPDLPAAVEGAPSLTLSYYYSCQGGISVGTLIMASNIPDGLDVQTIGLAYIKEPANSFNPSEYKLTLNNKVTTARFSGISDSGLYILNIRNLGVTSNWAVKGYMTYYDSS